MKILVIGATSFWAHPLVEELGRRGHEVSVFSRDPRGFPDRWRTHLRCSFGEITHTHILEEAVEGVDRVLASLSPGYDPRRAEAIEVGGFRSILEATTRTCHADLVRLTTPSPLRQAKWWPMAVRRRADLIAETASIPCCLAEMGWAPEMLSPLRQRDMLWLPHPPSAPGRLRWQSRSRGVSRLADLLGLKTLPKRITLRGDDPATLVELSTRICVQYPKTQRVFVPGAVFRWACGILPGIAHTGLRLIKAAQQNETSQTRGTENSLDDWR